MTASGRKQPLVINTDLEKHLTRMRKITIFVLSIVAVVACSDDYVVQRNSDEPPFFISGEFDPDVEQFRIGGSKVSAVVEIANETAETQQFSTMWLWIRIPGYDPVRAYHHSMASASVDTEPIEIGAKTAIEMPVYWVLPTDDVSDINVEYVTMKFIRK